MSVQFLKYNVDLLCRKQSGSQPKKKAGRMSSCHPIFLFPWLYLPRFSLAYHPRPPPLVLLLTVRVPFSSCHWLWPQHPLLSPGVSLTCLHCFTAAFRATKAWSSEGMLQLLPQLWCQPRALCLNAAVCVTASGQQRSKPYAWFSFTPCHYGLLEKQFCTEGF